LFDVFARSRKKVIEMPDRTPMDTLKILTGQQALDAYKALSDDSRRQILHALRARKMSTTELLEFLCKQDPQKEIKPQTVRYHLKELEKCGLIQMDGYEPAGNGDSHIMQKLWRATAENVFITTGDLNGFGAHDGPILDKTLDIVATMTSLGFKFESQDEIQKIAEAMTARDKIITRGQELARESLRQASEIDPALYVIFRNILTIVRLNDQDYEEYWKTSHILTDGLRAAHRRGGGPNPKVY
jgi:DNA-binding transcriptional ArsR family regulator